MKVKKLIYEIQHNIGIEPKWERDLIDSDTYLKMFLQWRESGKCCPSKCDELYHNRLNYLKGWIE